MRWGYQLFKYFRVLGEDQPLDTRTFHSSLALCKRRVAIAMKKVRPVSGFCALMATAWRFIVPPNAPFNRANMISVPRSISIQAPSFVRRHGNSIVETFRLPHSGSQALDWMEQLKLAATAIADHLAERLNRCHRRADGAYTTLRQVFLNAF